ncbi:MAG: hypothetical protein AAF216_04370 [Pseudomonadota bacterium]
MVLSIVHDAIGALLRAPLTAFVSVLAVFGVARVSGSLAWPFAGAVVFAALVITACVLVLRMERLSWSGGLGTAPKLAVSMVLTLLILAFLGLLAVFGSSLASLAIMAGAGFDFSAEDQAAAMEAFQSTPGWQLCMVVFGLAGLVFLFAIVRSLPVIAASVRDNRIVAMEAFGWTRGRLRELVPASLVIFAAPAGIAIWSMMTGKGFVFATSIGVMWPLWCAISSTARTRFGTGAS